ncbi:MAG: hypothetical protein AB1531_01620 [Chloroflexota bacterium]
MQNDAARITLLVTQTLEQIGIPYAVGGSFASSLHGVMRSTLDVDILADMRLEHIPPLVAALSQEFYADDEMMRDAIEHHSSFNLISSFHSPLLSAGVNRGYNQVHVYHAALRFDLVLGSAPFPARLAQSQGNHPPLAGGTGGALLSSRVQHIFWR